MMDQFWERLAQMDPLWAVLSEPSKKGRQWDIGEFLQTGRREISLLMFQLRDLGYSPRGGTALDFGCGVGRLSQPLAEHFSQVIGVDVSPTMIRLAEKLNRHGARVTYVENHHPHLSRVDSQSIDFVYSDIVLQHIEPQHSVVIIEEFIRILRPNGIAVFQLPSHRRPQMQASVPRAMPEAAYQATIQVLRPITALRPSDTATLWVSVVNSSRLPWIVPDGHLRVGNHWLDARTLAMLVQDDGRADLTMPLQPQQCASVPLTITAPKFSGDYICEIDVVHEGIAWFADTGAAPTRLPILIKGDVPVRTTSSPVISAEQSSFGLPTVDIYADLPQNVQEPGEFPMFGVPQETVRRLVASSGSRIVLEEQDERCGHEWIGFRYFVQKQGSAS